MSPLLRSGPSSVRGGVELLFLHGLLRQAVKHEVLGDCIEAIWWDYRRKYQA